MINDYWEEEWATLGTLDTTQMVLHMLTVSMNFLIYRLNDFILQVRMPLIKHPF